MGMPAGRGAAIAPGSGPIGGTLPGHCDAPVTRPAVLASSRREGRLPQMAPAGAPIGYSGGALIGMICSLVPPAVGPAG